MKYKETGGNTLNLGILGKSKHPIHLMEAIARSLVRFRIFWVMLAAALLLSGCVKYDVGVNFEGEHRGQIIQHIKLGEQLTSLNSSAAQEWLNNIERRSRQLQGKTKRISKQEIEVAIPFSNGAELETKFNDLFEQAVSKNSSSDAKNEISLPKVNSHLSLSQSNLLFWVRNKLIYDLDLSGLGVVSNTNNTLVSSALNVEFSLNTPWGARNVDATNTIKSVTAEKGRQLVWQLKPGQINHLEAVFWLPSPLGIGTVAIALFIAAGIYLKDKFFTKTPTQPTQPSAIPE